MLTLTPLVCVAAGLAVSKLMDVYLKDVDAVPETKHVHKVIEKKKKSPPSERKEKTPAPESIEASSPVMTKAPSMGIWMSDTKVTVMAAFLFLLAQFVFHCTWVTSLAYSSPSVVLAYRDQVNYFNNL